jgi:hypothetical protein
MRNVANKLAGALVPAMMTAALLAPGPLDAAEAVAIADPNTGAKAYVDGGRKLYVHDPIAGYANNPANFVSILKTAVAGDSLKTIYTPPAGKALIIKSAHFSYLKNTGRRSIHLEIRENGNALMGFETVEVAGTKSAAFEPGIVLHGGAQLKMLFLSWDGPSSAVGYVSLQGYLVPSFAVPPAGSAQAAEELVQTGPAAKQDVKP